MYTATTTHHGKKKSGTTTVQAEEQRLPADERGEVPPPWEPHGGLRESSANEGNEIAGRLPPDTHQGVHRPDVEVLEPVPPPGLLRGSEPRQRDLAHVVVTPVDVRIGVVRHVVLDSPRVAAEAEQRIGGPAEQMVVAALSKERPMVRVVLHAQRGQDEAHRETRKARSDHQWARGAPGSGTSMRSPSLPGRSPSSRKAAGSRIATFVGRRDTTSTSRRVSRRNAPPPSKATLPAPATRLSLICASLVATTWVEVRRPAHTLGHTPTDRATDGNRGAAAATPRRTALSD